MALSSWVPRVTSATSLPSLRGSILQESPAQSYLTVCLKLHETVCKVTKEHAFHELPALSAEIVRMVITLKPLVVSGIHLGYVTPSKGTESQAVSIPEGGRLILGWRG